MAGRTRPRKLRGGVLSAIFGEGLGFSTLANGPRASESGPQRIRRFGISNLYPRSLWLFARTFPQAWGENVFERQLCRWRRPSRAISRNGPRQSGGDWKLDFRVDHGNHAGHFSNAGDVLGKGGAEENERQRGAEAKFTADSTAGVNVPDENLSGRL